LWECPHCGEAADVDEDDLIEPEDNDDAQVTFLVSAVAMLAKLAKADGVVSRDEIALVDHFFKEELELDEDDQQAARDIFREARDSEHSFEDFAQQFSEVFEDSSEMREAMFEVLVALARADGTIHPAEERMLRAAAAIFNLPPGALDALFHGSADLSACYAELDCSPDASDAEVKRAYRGKVAEYHPDKIASKGLPDGFMKFANQKVQELKEAYDRIMDSRRV